MRLSYGRHLIMSQFQKYLRILTLLLGCTFLTMAAAQEPRRGETVTERSRPDMDVRGIRIGAFETFPAISIGLMHDDNIYADNDLVVDDLITVVRPEITLVGDWNRAALEVGADFEAARYDEFDTEDYEDWRLWGELGMELGRGRLSGELSYEDLHERRTSADDQRGIKPTEYSTGSWFMEYRNTYGRVNLRADARQRGFDFDDTITLGGPESNADRDRKRNGHTGDGDGAHEQDVGEVENRPGRHRERDTGAGGLGEIVEERVLATVPASECQREDDRHHEDPDRVVPIEKLEADLTGELERVRPRPPADHAQDHQE